MANREHWSSRLGFILTAAGSAIGLGTMWKLPYIVGQNGGGAFILLFLLFVVLVGIPLFIAELVVGRQTQKAVVGTFQSYTTGGSSWSIVGWMAVAASVLVAGWYCVVSGWALNYLLMTFTNAFANKSVAEIGGIFELFRSSGDLNVLWQVIFLLGTSVILLRGIAKGIEYWSRILTSLLFVLLLILAIYSATLDGFGQAVRYVLVPDFSHITGASILTALGLALFALSLGQGIMVTYGSYMSPGDDIPKTSLIVSGAIMAVSVFVALMIFPMIFTFGFAPQEGEGLVFKTLPYVFQQLPMAMILSMLFFTLLSFAAITSAVGQMEVVIANFVDLYAWPRFKAVFVTIGMVFLVGLPTALSDSHFSVFPHWKQIFLHSFLDTNYIVIDWMLVIFALGTALFVGFRMPQETLRKSFLQGTTLGYLYFPWLICIRFVVPLAIGVVIAYRIFGGQ